ncbi:hypothetical protein MTO96_050937 [Rhipicephalus appendiculatus]
MSDDRKAKSVSWRRATLKLGSGGRSQARRDEAARNFARGQASTSPTPSVTAVVNINWEPQTITRKPSSNGHCTSPHYVG